MPNTNDDVTTSSILTPFINNVNNIILNQARSQSNVPNFSGSVRYVPTYTIFTSSDVTAPAFTNPAALPSNDLDVISNAGISNVSIGSSGSDVNASIIYNTLCNIVKKLTRVRNFSSSWYHKTQASYVLINSVSGKAMFKETLPTIQGTGSIQDNTKSSGWNRSINGSAVQNISITNPGITTNSNILASSLNTFFTNLNNAWTAASNNAIGYTFYSCHSNCHSNCHSSCHGSGRARR